MPESIDAQIVKVADAATAQINAAVEDGYFVGHQFEAKRGWASWHEELTGNTCTRVDVRAARYDRSGLETRSTIGYQTAIEIYVRREFAEADRGQDRKIRREVIDQLVRLTEQIHELFITEKRPETFDDCVWTDSKILAIASPVHLEKGVYFGAVRVTFDAPRDFA